MIQSMTGFGKVTAELPSKKVTVEIKALNSKQLDLSTRIPAVYREKEMQVRNLLLQTLERGKIEFNIYVEYIGKDVPTQINPVAFENYYNQIKAIAERLQIALPSDWFQTLLRMPDVVKTDVQELDDAEWQVVENAVKEAIRQLRDFRIQEGAMLQKLFEMKFHLDDGKRTGTGQEAGLHRSRDGTRNQHAGFEKQPCGDAENRRSDEGRVGTD